MLAAFNHKCMNFNWIKKYKFYIDVTDLYLGEDKTRIKNDIVSLQNLIILLKSNLLLESSMKNLLQPSEKYSKLKYKHKLVAIEYKLYVLLLGQVIKS